MVSVGENLPSERATGTKIRQVLLEARSPILRGFHMDVYAVVCGCCVDQCTHLKEWGRAEISRVFIAGRGEDGGVITRGADGAPCGMARAGLTCAQIGHRGSQP